MSVAARTPLALALLAVLGLAGCSPANIDVAATIKITNVVTGWYDAGVVGGQNKLVPSASFSVTNAGGDRINSLQVFSVFRFIGETEELGSSMIVLHGADALGPNATSKPFTVRGTWGFASLKPRAEMLVAKEMRDAHVEIFAKYGAGSFIKVADARLRRQLLTQ